MGALGGFFAGLVVGCFLGVWRFRVILRRQRLTIQALQKDLRQASSIRRDLSERLRRAQGTLAFLNVRLPED